MLGDQANDGRRQHVGVGAQCLRRSLGRLCPRSPGGLLGDRGGRRGCLGGGVDGRDDITDAHALPLFDALLLKDASLGGVDLDVDFVSL